MRLNRTRLLIVDDDPELRELMRRIVAEIVDEIRECPDGASGAAAARTEPPSVMLLDLGLPDVGGLDVLATVKAELPDLPVVVVSGDTGIDSAVEAMRRGALDFVTKPFLPERLATSVRNALRVAELGRRLCEAEQRANETSSFADLVGCSDFMRGLVANLRELSHSSANVLIRGETGVGKELVARALHWEGPRSRGPFVELSCAAVPAGLLEGELFGHEPTAFSGVAQRRVGKIEAASGGTLFLDEIGRLDQRCQAKLLGVLQTRQLERLGGDRAVGVDVRIVAATNRGLFDDVRAGRFQADLFHALSVYALHVAPLRERKTDIPLLVERFVRSRARAEGRRPPAISRQAMNVLGAYDWPGHMRELENVIRRTLSSLAGAEVRAGDLPSYLREGGDPVTAHATCISPDVAPGTGISPLAEVEKRHVVRALELCSGNLSEAARALGIGRTTLYRKLEKYGLARAVPAALRRA